MAFDSSEEIWAYEVILDLANPVAKKVDPKALPRLAWWFFTSPKIDDFYAFLDAKMGRNKEKCIRETRSSSSSGISDHTRSRHDRDLDLVAKIKEALLPDIFATIKCELIPVVKNALLSGLKEYIKFLWRGSR
ncbi:hypothetical protein C2S52_013145 [Perilla frutescens var. hirtella]|nr:hypothetical protein C2S52_013145 [Perilla frutescens var. hirtella]